MTRDTRLDPIVFTGNLLSSPTHPRQQDLLSCLSPLAGAEAGDPVAICWDVTHDGQSVQMDKPGVMIATGTRNPEWPEQFMIPANPADLVGHRQYQDLLRVLLDRNLNPDSTLLLDKAITDYWDISGEYSGYCYRTLLIFRHGGLLVPDHHAIIEDSVETLVRRIPFFRVPDGTAHEAISLSEEMRHMTGYARICLGSTPIEEWPKDLDPGIIPFKPVRLQN